MSNVLHWTPEQLEAYRLRLGGRPEKPAPRERSGQKGQATPKAPPRACAESEPGDPSALPDYRPSAVCAAPFGGWRGRQTDTEKRYNANNLHGLGRFEAVTLILPGGGRYTPDFMTVDDGAVTGTLFIYNEPLGYNHVLSFSFPTTLLSGSGGRVEARLYAYIPLHNVTEKFFNQNNYRDYNHEK